MTRFVSDLGYEATTTGDLPWHPESNILTHKSPCEPAARLPPVRAPTPFQGLHVSSRDEALR